MILSHGLKQRIHDAIGQIFRDYKKYYKQEVQDFVEDVKKREDQITETVTMVFGQVFFVFCVLFVLLVFLPINLELKLWTFMIYVAISMIFSLLAIRIRIYRYSIKEYVNSSSIKKSFVKTGIINIIMIGIFSFFFINSIFNIGLFPIVPLKLFELNGATFYLFVLTFYIYFSFSTIIIPLISREYNFYVAKQYFDRIADSQASGRIKLLKNGVNAYNKFLKRKFGLQINDSVRIISKIIADSETDINDQIGLLVTSFKNQNEFMAPIKTISKLLGNEDADELLIRISTLEKLKNYNFLYGSISGIILGIITLIYR
jgi:hypothetical protein